MNVHDKGFNRNDIKELHLNSDKVNETEITELKN